MRNFAKVFLVSLFVFSCCINVNAQNKEGFPLRVKYPDVPYIVTQPLADKYDDVIIIDVRSKFEYDILHMTKARHIPVADASFPDRIKELLPEDKGTLVVFYCNGRSCAKSYKAGKKIMEAGYNNVAVYDPGIFEWAMAYPDKAMLFYESPVNLNHLISNEQLQARFIDFEEIENNMNDPSVVIIDIRDQFQRKKIPVLDNLRNIPLDRMLSLIKKKEMKDKKIYFIDAVGKQVRWLQYHLEVNRYKNYHFLKKGILSISADKLK